MSDMLTLLMITHYIPVGKNKFKTNAPTLLEKYFKLSKGKPVKIKPW